MKPEKSVALKLSPVLSILCTAWLALASVGASAAPLNLTQTYPDFFVGSLAYSYNAGTGNLTITGLVNSYTGYTPPAPQLQVTNHPTDGTYLESFSLSAQLDGSGNVLSGSFRIDGFVRNSSFVPPFTACASAPYCEYYDGSDDPAGGLLSGSLTEFGWSLNSGSNGVLEFRFDDADGIIADLGTGYHSGGMILTVQSSSLTNFGAQALTTSWTGTGLGDVFVVPVPAAAWLFLSGLGVMVGFAKRRGGRDRT